MKGEYKNHSFEVITSKSIYELMEICPYTDEDEERINAEMESVCEEACEILEKHELDGVYPIVFDFEEDSKKIYKQIIQDRGLVEDYERDIEYELGIPIRCAYELNQYVVDKMGADLVKWDTGYIGWVGYNNYGTCSGVEIIPIKVAN